MSSSTGVGMACCTYPPLKIRVLHSLKTLGSGYPLMQHYIPEGRNSQYTATKAIYVGGPKSNWTLNLARKLEVVV